MSEEWGPWIEHDGKGCPCVGEFVQAVHLCPPSYEESVFVVAGSQGGGSWDWSNWPFLTKVIRYRIKKPRGLTILEGLIENLPEPEKVDA